MPSYDQERAAARDAARDAGLLCLAVRQAMLGTLDKMEKAGKEPVTIADYGAQAIVLRYVAKRFPQDASLAEEWADEFVNLATEDQRTAVLRHVGEIAGQPATLDEVRRWLDHGRGGRGTRVWAVDPIDGTKGFLRGDQFAVAVALLVDSQPVVGALACPALVLDPARPEGGRGIIATAVRGEGALLEPLDGGPPRSMHVSPIMDGASARTVESVDAGHTDHEFSAQVLERAGIGGKAVRMDSQAKYVAVADGRAELYIRHSRGGDYREKVWDHAAGVLIVEEAGGRVTDLHGRPIDFTHGATLADNHGILATNSALHDVLLEAIRNATESA